MNGIIVQSVNFEFLRSRWPEVADLGGFAEHYAWSDPASALVKLRSFVESMIQRLYDEHRLATPPASSLYDLLDNHQFKAAIPPVVINAFHLIRKLGNKAAHGQGYPAEKALGALRDAFEHDVNHQPTPTGMGYADYVLWDDDGKPLAVIEAKKTAKSADLGKKQAELYADGLEKTFGLRPAIFYTNGYDIFFWDDSQGDVPRRLYGFYSKDSLQYLVRFQRRQRKELSQVPVRKDIVDRLYQIEAIRRVAEKFTSRRRKALVVQATGTGKTRVAIALTDLLLRASWVKRVLFLCDRKELRKQAKNAFTEFISEPLTVVRADTAKDRDKRVYLATYPAMNKIFQSFDVGFFDLIIFARNHQHAVLLAEVFDELYPQYGGKFCRVIDNYDPRAEQLIDDFKAGPETDPRIAISVDMLDTGIDVPEIVNLVFAKPIRSLVKFEQMIGRGTRLCADLFGPGKDKSAFYIFDHWGNFAFFGKNYQKVQPTVSKSLMQQLFEARIDLARCALDAGEPKIFEQAALLLKEDLERLCEETISVREKWREKRTLSRLEVLTRFDPATEQALRRHMAPLMQWADIRGQIEAYRFDLLVSELEIARLKKTGRWKDLKAQVVDQVSRLPMHLNPVREKSDFVAGHCELSANQIAFLNLLKNHISRYGSIRVEQLYEPPFTTLHSEGLDGLFHEERLATELLGIVKSFQPEVSQ